ncbi:MAG: hypothetical protein KC420_23185, partial [Myxococcales bacterium]|nr:hypothetical protein [Myxococcales bacterium]
NTNEIPRQTGVLRLHLDADQGCVDELRFHPAYIKRYPTPHPVPAEKGMGKVVRRRVRDLSKELGKTVFEVEAEDLVLRGFDCPPVPIRPEPGAADTDTDTDGDTDGDTTAGE